MFLKLLKTKDVEPAAKFALGSNSIHFQSEKITTLVAEAAEVFELGT